MNSKKRRSCERFSLLAEHAEDEELAGLYRGLWRSEQGHYEEFLAIAREFFDAEMVEQRWEEMLSLEAEILARQDFWPGMHSWIEDCIDPER